jgi:hypothetical protein
MQEKAAALTLQTHMNLFTAPINNMDAKAQQFFNLQRDIILKELILKNKQNSNSFPRHASLTSIVSNSYEEFDDVDSNEDTTVV